MEDVALHYPESVHHSEPSVFARYSYHLTRRFYILVVSAGHHHLQEPETEIRKKRERNEV